MPLDNGGNDGMLGGNNFAEFLLLLLLIGGRNSGLFGGGENAVTNEFQMTQGKLDGLTASTNAGFGNTQMGFAAMAQQLSKCCCDTQLLIEQRNNDTNRHVDQVLFQLGSQSTANTQQVVDRIDRLQDDMKDQRIRELEGQLSACNTRDTVGAAVAPISAALANVMAQLNCGVKAVTYTPSLPVAAPFAYGPPVASFGYPGQCAPGGFGWN